MRMKVSPGFYTHRLRARFTPQPISAKHDPLCLIVVISIAIRDSVPNHLRANRRIGAFDQLARKLVKLGQAEIALLKKGWNIGIISRASADEEGGRARDEGTEDIGVDAVC